jgi:hypothetical protein
MAEVLLMPRADALPQPRLSRVTLGLLVAPAVGTAAFLAIFMLYEVPEVLSKDPAAPTGLSFDWAFLSVAGMIGYVVAGTTTLIVGVPLYLVLRRRIRFTPGRAAAFGAVLTLVMVGYLAAIGAPPPIPPFFNELEALALFTGPGLLAGLAFWLCAFWRDPASSQTERP